MVPHLAVGRLDRKGNASPRHNMRRSGPVERLLSTLEYRYTGAGLVGPWRLTPDEAARAFDELWAKRVSS